MFEAGKLRQEAKRIRAKKMIESKDEAIRLEGKAELAEIDAMAETTQKNFNAAIAELATINRRIAVVNPLRRPYPIPRHTKLPRPMNGNWS